MNTMIWTLALLMAAQITFAKGQDRGGGDPCEDQIKIIRNDIGSWIKGGGPASLRLPEGITTQLYSSAMLEALGRAQISCVSPGTPGYPVMVNGISKVCSFSISAQEMTCDRTSFLNLSETQQYVLIHHEYAGLARIENPNGADSDYSTSNQLTKYLVNQVVKRLAIKPVDVSASSQWEQVPYKELTSTVKALHAALDQVEFSDCTKELNKPSIELHLCEGQDLAYDSLEVSLQDSVNRFTFFAGVSACKNEKQGVRYLMRATSGAPALFNVDNLRGHLAAVPTINQYETTYFLDATQTKITKIVINHVYEDEKNMGTIVQPNFVKERVTVSSTTCHAK